MQADYIATERHQFCQQLAGLLADKLPHKAPGHPIIIAIDGRSGSGKTTLTHLITKRLTAGGYAHAIFRLDDTYQGWQGLKAAIQAWKQSSADLSAGRSTNWYGWDWEENRPTGPHRFTPSAKILLVEGVGSLTGTADIRCWVERPSNLRQEDALERDGETYRPFWNIWAHQEEDLLKYEASCYQQVDILYQRT